MAEVDIQSGLPEKILEMMQSPEIKGIINSLKSGDGGTQDDTNTVPIQPAGTDALGLSPDMLSKLPAVISALSGMGMGKAEKPSPLSGLSAKEKQRKALLLALKPYLSPKRRSLVDAILGIDSLTGILGAFIPTDKNI